MWGLIAGALQGIVTGIVGPVFSYLGKKQDVTLDGFKSATDEDRQTATAWLDYQERIQALKLQAANWWGPRALYMVVGGSAAIHCAAIFIDSTFRFGWAVPPCPKPYDSYEAWVVGSLFVVSLAKGPISAASQWLHRR